MLSRLTDLYLIYLFVFNLFVNLLTHLVVYFTVCQCTGLFICLLIYIISFGFEN